MQLSGDTTVEAVINELPQLSAGNNSSVNSAGGSGVLTANLRGLGAARTLTLVNGRRFIPANSAGSVDLATIPTALVERVEIITGGASAVYGSDAIAGAVNFLLRDDFEGLEVSTQYGETSESDGRTVQYDALFGSNFAEDRGNVTLYASHSDARSGVHAEPRLLQSSAQRSARAQRLGQHSGRTRQPERGADRVAERRRRTRRHPHRTRRLHDAGQLDPLRRQRPGAASLRSGDALQLRGGQLPAAAAGAHAVLRPCALLAQRKSRRLCGSALRAGRERVPAGGRFARHRDGHRTRTSKCSTMRPTRCSRRTCAPCS